MVGSKMSDCIFAMKKMNANSYYPIWRSTENRGNVLWFGIWSLIGQCSTFIGAGTVGVVEAAALSPSPNFLTVGAVGVVSNFLRKKERIIGHVSCWTKLVTLSESKHPFSVKTFEGVRIPNLEAAVVSSLAIVVARSSDPLCNFTSIRYLCLLAPRGKHPHLC